MSAPTWPVPSLGAPHCDTDSTHGEANVARVGADIPLAEPRRAALRHRLDAWRGRLGVRLRRRNRRIGARTDERLPHGSPPTAVGEYVVPPLKSLDSVASIPAMTPGSAKTTPSSRFLVSDVLEKF